MHHTKLARILALVIVFVAVFEASSASPAQAVSAGVSQSSAKRKAQKLVSAKTERSQELVSIAAVANRDAKKARTALDKAGIIYGGGGSLATGITVKKSDAVRARAVLKADAKLRHYNVYL